jgi:hypothetical protein
MFATMGAWIVHSLVQHPLVEIVPEIVVVFANLVRTVPFLQIEQFRLHHRPHCFEIPFECLMEICPQGPVEELIQRLAIPPTIHISFARTESSVTQYPSVETLVVHLDVKGERKAKINCRKTSDPRIPMRRKVCRSLHNEVCRLHGHPSLAEVLEDAVVGCGIAD